MTEIIISVITGALTLIGVCVTAWASSHKTGAEVASRLEKAQADTSAELETLQKVTAAELEALQKVTSANLETVQRVTGDRIDELTREVREHNNFARRVPVLEEQMKVANHRLADLENKP